MKKEYKYFYKDTKNPILEGDIVKHKHKNTLFKTMEQPFLSQILLKDINKEHYYYKSYFEDLEFVSREFNDPEEIMS